MKIGLISDIHGNQQALTKVLGQLYNEHVDLVLCAGDLVCYGAHANQVLDLMRSCAIACVAGNYDAAVAWNWPSASSKPSRSSDGNIETGCPGMDETQPP